MSFLPKIIDFVRVQELPLKYELRIKITQILPFSENYECSHTVILGRIEAECCNINFNDSSYKEYTCYFFDKTWKETDLQSAKFHMLKLIRWLSNDILETMKFEGLNSDPDIWKTCETK